MKHYKYIVANIMGEIYLTPKYKRKYHKQLAFIKKLNNRLRKRGYSGIDYIRPNTGSMFLIIDKIHKQFHWDTSLMVAIAYSNYGHRGRPLPIDWINTGLDILLNKHIDDNYLLLLGKLSRLEFDRKWSQNNPELLN